MQRSDDSGGDFRDRAEQSRLTEDSLQVLRLEEIEQIQEIIRLYTDIEVPRPHVEVFKQHLLYRKDSWFVEVLDCGLIYLTDIIPTFTANFHVIFWDKKFGADRRELCKNVLATAFAEFELTRVMSAAPEINATLAYTALKKIGFVKEGVLRKAWREVQDFDLFIYGLLAEEAKEWQAIPHLTSGALTT